MANHTSRLLVTAWLTVTVFASLHASAETTASEQRSDTTNESSAFQWDARVQRGQLRNGLRYYLVPAEHPGKGLSIQLLVKAGSLDETDQQAGVAHMVEHMVFHESQDFPQGLHARIKELGWRVGEHVNAMTNFERTLYTLNLHGSNGAQWDEGLQLLSQIASYADIRDSSLEGERKIVLEEWRGKLGVNERMERQRRALLRAGSLYPERPTIGNEASIRAHHAHVLQDFYSTWYHPNNMALLVVGNVDASALQERIEHWFGKAPSNPLPTRVSRDPVLLNGLRIARMQDPESGSSQVAWVYRFLGNASANAEGLRARLIDMVTNELLQQRMRVIKELSRAPVESLVSAKGQIGSRTFSLALSARVAVDGHTEGLRTLAETMERLRREGFLAEDFERQRALYLRSNAAAEQSAADRNGESWALLLNEAVAQDRILQDPSEKRAMVDDILSKLSLEDVHARLSSWLDSPDQLLFMIAPGNTELTLPSQQQVRSLVRDIAEAPLPVLQPGSIKVASPPLPDSQTHGNIVQARRQGPVLHWRLSNGDQMVWLQRANQDGSVMFSARSSAGYRIAGLASWQGQMALQLGAQSSPAGWSERQFSAWLRQTPWALNVSQDADSLRWDARIPAAHLPRLAQLYWLRAQANAISQEAAAESVQALLRQKARSTSSSRDAAARAMSQLRWILDTTDASPSTEALQAVDANTLQGLWEQQAATPTTYFLSGEVDESIVRALVERYFAVLPRAPQGLESLPIPYRSGRNESVLQIGLEPQASLQAYGATPRAWSALAAMQVNVLSQAMYRALRQELREKENGIYRLRFSLTLNPDTQRLESEIAFTADPQRMPVLWERAQTLLANPVNFLEKDQLADIILRLQASEAKRLSDDASWFQRLQLSWRKFGDARYLEQLPTLTDALDTTGVWNLASMLDLRRDLASVLVYPR